MYSLYFLSSAFFRHRLFFNTLTCTRIFLLYPAKEISHKKQILAFIGHTGGPDPVPELRPTKIFYNLEPGTLLPHINCSSDCNPPCEMRWEKIGSQRTLSTNGTLSLGKLDRKSSGEYVCIATRNQTSRTGRISIIVFVNEGSVCFYYA